jgi:membrane protein DedA with SNARE-associated domain
METLLSIIKDHTYLVLFITTTAEGPIASFVSWWLAAQWMLRLEYVFLITLAGDILGDIWLYIIGRFLYKNLRIRKYHKTFTEKAFFKKIYTNHPFFYFFIAKITPYFSTPALISAGIQKIKFSYFLLYSLGISIIVKTTYVGIGYLGSISIKQLENFLHGRKIVGLYILVGAILFQSIKRWYKKITNILTHRQKK